MNAPPYGDVDQFLLYCDIIWIATLVGMTSARIIPSGSGVLRIALTDSVITSEWHWTNMYRYLRLGLPEHWELYLVEDQ